MSVRFQLAGTGVVMSAADAGDAAIISATGMPTRATARALARVMRRVRIEMPIGFTFRASVSKTIQQPDLAKFVHRCAVCRLL